MIWESQTQKKPGKATKIYCCLFSPHHNPIKKVFYDPSLQMRKSEVNNFPKDPARKRGAGNQTHICQPQCLQSSTLWPLFSFWLKGSQNNQWKFPNSPWQIWVHLEKRDRSRFSWGTKLKPSCVFFFFFSFSHLFKIKLIRESLDGIY